MGSYRGYGVFVKMCVVVVCDWTWVSMLSFSCDWLGSGFAFITSIRYYQCMSVLTVTEEFLLAKYSKFLIPTAPILTL